MTALHINFRKSIKEQGYEKNRWLTQGCCFSFGVCRRQFFAICCISGRHHRQHHCGDIFYRQLAGIRCNRPYGANSLWSRDGSTYTWRFSVDSPGTYQILMWWTNWPSRSQTVPVDINYEGGTRRVTINQQQDGAGGTASGSLSMSPANPTMSR